IADKGGHPRPFILSISTIRTCVWNSTRRSKPWDSLSHEAFDCKRQHVGLKKSLRGYSYPLANCTGTPVTTDIAITPDSDLTDGKASVTTGQIPLSSPGTFLCLKAQYLGDTNYSASDLSTPEPLCAFPFVH